MTLRLLRRLTDAALLLLMLAPLAYAWTGYTLHAWAGWLWLAALAVHGALNKNWYQHLFRGPYSPRRAFGTAVNALLWALTLGVFVSGWRLAGGSLDAAQAQSVRIMHVSCAWWLLLLCGVHAGLHGELLARAVRRAGRNLKIILYAAGFLAALWGAAGFIRLRLWEKLLFRSSFGFWEGSWAGFLAASACVFWLCAAVTHMLAIQGENK